MLFPVHKRSASANYIPRWIMPVLLWLLGVPLFVVVVLMLFHVV
jgi:hypothetical protein